MPPSSLAFAGELTPYVDTRIGTDLSPTAVSKTLALSEKAGNTQPTAVVPFGMLQWGPDTPHPGSTSASYLYSDSTITGFSLTHLSGPGCRNSGELPILPYVASDAAAAFDHADELAQPGYYSVRLKNGIQVELTSTARSGLGRFTFPAASFPKLRLAFTETQTGKFPGSLTEIDSRHFLGWEQGGNFCGDHNSYRVYFALELEKPLQSFKSTGGAAVLALDPEAGPAYLVKVGLSYDSEQEAQANLEAENPAWDFDQLHAQADQQWDGALSRVKVSGGTDPALRTFYTALYHTLLHPNLTNDADGTYLGFDGKVHALAPAQSAQYANYSGWDIYRSESQLLAFLLPGQTSAAAQSLVNDGAQCGGAMPKWAANTGETGEMIGDPGPIIVANSYAFGATNFDQNAALGFMRQSGLTPKAACGGHELRPGLQQYLKMNFVPWNAELFKFYNQTASETLEYAVADFAIARFAEALGQTALAGTFDGHAASWKKLFDPKTGYVAGRFSNGFFFPLFGPGMEFGYTEGNSAQYTWDVPFDVAGLVEMMGGPVKALPRLDNFLSELNVGKTSPHLWIGNEPSFFQPWIYNWLGQPGRTQEIVSRIMSEEFNDQPGGLPGNDDLGATSSWYVWAALGLYPAIPGVGGFTLTRPAFPSIEISMENGNTLTITTTGTGSIQSVTLDGSEWSGSWLPFAKLGKSSQLTFNLGQSSGTWATGPADLPPSME